MMANRPKKSAAPKKAAAKKAGTGKPDRREPNRSEREAIERATDTRVARPARPQVSRSPNANPAVLELDALHSDKQGASVLLAETFATRSDDLVNSSLVHLAKLTSVGDDASIPNLNASLSIIGAIAPQDELEAALATQIAAVHDLSLAMLAKAKGAKYLEHARDFGNLATKLQRTMTTQIKTLADWRRGGVQEVIHRHIHVYEGGQAVVAEHITVGGQADGTTAHNAHAQLPPMRGALPHQAGAAMPIPGDGERSMPDARRLDAERGGPGRQSERLSPRRRKQVTPGDDEGAEAA